MSFIVVTPLSHLAQTAQKYQPHDMVTLINAGTPVVRPAMIAPEHHLFLAFNDINEPRDGLVPPDAIHIKQLLTAAKSWNQEAPLLIHCFMGISRSTAAAYIVAAALNPKRDEKELAAALRSASPSATPNARLIALADNILQRRGRMVDAIAAIGRGEEAFEGTPFVLNIF